MTLVKDVAYRSRDSRQAGRPDDSGVFLSFDADSHVGEDELGCTDPVQTYVDLIHSGGRGEEAAEALAAQKILPAWKSVARP
jgi:uncharacterized protein with von Willebrand factor type A (vWA) domain